MSYLLVFNLLLLAVLLSLNCGYIYFLCIYDTVRFRVNCWVVLWAVSFQWIPRTFNMVRCPLQMLTPGTMNSLLYQRLPKIYHTMWREAIFRVPAPSLWPALCRCEACGNGSRMVLSSFLLEKLHVTWGDNKQGREDTLLMMMMMMMMMKMMIVRTCRKIYLHAWSKPEGLEGQLSS